MIAEPRPTRSRSIRLAAALISVGCVASVGAGLALAASGDFDRSFSGNGIAKTRFPTVVAAQPNGRVLVAGSTSSGDLGLERFRSNGKLDGSFGDEGTVRIDFGGPAGAEDVAVRHGGRIVVVGDGYVGNREVIGIARLLPNGAPDPSFSGDGKEILDPFQDPVEARRDFVVALQSEGRILVGGETSVFGGGDNPGFVARLEPDGDLDPSFADGGVKTIDFPKPGAIVDTSVNDLIVDSRGRIAAAVSTVEWDIEDENPDPRVRAVMVRLRSNGDFDSSFSGNGWKRLLGRASALFSIAAAPHGRLVGAGRVGGAVLVVSVKGSGPFDRSFAGDGVKTTTLDTDAVYPENLILQRNGKPLIAGQFEKGSTFHGIVVARFRPNGKLDRSFSGDGKRLFKRILNYRPLYFSNAAMQANGKLLLTGAPWRQTSPFKAFVARLKNHEQPFVAP